MTIENDTETNEPSTDFGDDDMAAIQADLDADAAAERERVERISSPPDGQPDEEPAAAEPDQPAAAGSEPEPKAEPESLISRVRAMRAGRQQPAPTPETPQAPALDVNGIQELANQQALAQLMAQFNQDPIAMIERAGHDPTEAYKRMTALAVNREGTQAADGVAEVKQQIEELKKAREEDARLRAEAAQQQLLAMAQQAYIADTGNAETFPINSLIEPEFRLSLGQMISGMTGATDPAIIARDTESFLSDLISRAGAKPGAVTDKATGPSGETSPTTITPDMAGQTAGHREFADEEEELEWLLQQTQKDLDADARAIG